MTKRFAIVALLLTLAAACGGGKAKPSATVGSTPKATRETPPSGQANKPVVGRYVYELKALTGTKLPADFERIDDVTVNGDTVSISTSSNKSPNSVVFNRKFAADGITLVSSKTHTTDRDVPCDYKPPIKVVPFPLKAGTTPTQSWGDAAPCMGKTDVNVMGEEEVADAGGRKWKTWKIEERTTAGGLSTQLHWFSPELGLDVRNQSTSPNQSTLSVLRDYP